MLSTSDALKDAGAELFGINRDAVDSSIQLKGELSSNAELLELVQVQLKSTMEGLHFLDNLKCCFQTYKLGRDMVLPFLADGTTNDAEVLQKVKDFKAMGDRGAMIRLTLEDYQQAVSLQFSVLHKLHLRGNRLDHKLCKVKTWRKTWNIVYSTVKFAVMALSVVLALLTAPPAATATANGIGGVMALLQQWFDTKWDDYQRLCQAERDVTGNILNEASLTFHGVNDVGVLLRHLEMQIASLTHHDEFAIEEDEYPAARLMVVETIKRKAADVMASVESLGKEVDGRCEELRRSALTFLQSVTDQVGNFLHNGENNIPVGNEN